MVAKPEKGPQMRTVTAADIPATRDTLSREAFERACGVIPGGVNSPVRAFGAVGGTPRFIDRGEGAYIWDVDGNRYTDYVMSWGPLIHGHAFEPVVDAVARAARRGTSFGAPTLAETELAETIANAVPSTRMVRFVNSGTEASMSAIRLARAATGRDVIVKFAGNYHGHADALLVHAGSGSLTLGLPSSPGIPDAAAGATLVAPYNDLEAVAKLFTDHGDEIAAIIVEPIAANMGVILPAPRFLAGIQKLARKAGALFICDEVITGFRVGFGGAQSLFELEPDLTILGKIIGGGLPVGAYGGSPELMEQMSPVGPVYQAGTLSGNPLAMAAGIASARVLATPGFYESLNEATSRLASGLREAARAAAVSVTINAFTGMLTVFFSGGPVDSLAAAEASDGKRFARFFHAMLEHGVYLPPSPYEAWMVSSAHTADVIDRTVAVAAEAFAATKASGSTQ